jgi:hypothetical protein
MAETKTGRKPIFGRGNYAHVTQLRWGSITRYFESKEDAIQEARGIQYNMMKQRMTGRVHVLVSQFRRQVSHHWTKKDIIAFLNGDFGWTTIYDVSITGGKVVKFIDKVNQKRNYATLEEFTTPIVNPTPPMKNGLEIIQNNESLFELCKRAPTPTAFKMALRKIDMLKAPITASVAQYVWRVTHED